MSFPNSIRTFLTIVALVAAAGGGWYAARHLPAKHDSASSSERRILFYQSPMHPWIKSDKPGNCTICGMKLVAVYEGEAGAPVSGDLVTLSEQSTSVLRVATAPVKREPLHRSLRVAGQIDDNDSAHRRLSATVEGRIEKLFVPSVGAEVTEGQPLISFFSRELIVARGEFALALKQPPSPERESALAGSRQKLRRMGLTPAQIEKLPEQTGDTIELLAPASGTVVERKVYEGQYVKEGDVLFEIANFSQMWFVAEVYERDLAWIKLGQLVDISTPAVPGKIYTAPIEFIDPNVAESTRTARIRVVIENPHIGDPAKHRHELLHRVFANGVIRIDTPETLTIPRTAVLVNGSQPLVYVAKSAGAYEPREVKLGRVGDDYYEVLSGVTEGEQVVTNGNLLIDAQAQLNRGGSTHDQPSETPATFPALTESQRQSAGDILKLADTLALRLFSDDLAGFNLCAKDAAVTRAALEKAFVKSGAWEPLVAKIVATADFVAAPDIATARKLFQPLGDALVPLGGKLRAVDSAFASLKMYRCPMTADAFPGAPAKAAWMQLSAPIRNPYFGAEMPECGEEVKP